MQDKLPITCINCGSSNILIKREDAGFYKTDVGSVRKARTVAVCKQCGYTWVTSGPAITNNKKVGIPISTSILIAFVVFVIVGLLNGADTINDPEEIENYSLTNTDIALVTKPTSAYIIDSLQKVDNVLVVEEANKDNAPDDLLKDVPAGATSLVYFTLKDLVSDESISPVSVGVDLGGCIEVYKDVVYAQRRTKAYKFGKGRSLGTVVIRVSTKLNKKDAENLINDISNALINR